VSETIVFVVFETVWVVLAVFVDIREVDVPMVVVILKKRNFSISISWNCSKQCYQNLLPDCCGCGCCFCCYD